jgi:hypothetical protein
MTYSRPELTRLADACQAIQGSKDKSIPNAPDAVHPDQDVATQSAYEADE